ncbi:hypothetical protein HS088_TW09G00479 [Tripterygium wilfordii]|uniref:Uncharacterized protein n=1 Tax=Tripterygium wilfordii TaxID=458696 RepID=A0A7J7D7Y9_TRIWF|nr:uncharacterized protein LOC120006221 isoform X2 [Tripterygium wilfordii]KAF5742431.1 hypothetical protein HS088_TW09G00479 [Tripterygium wilfordii]
MASLQLQNSWLSSLSQKPILFHSTNLTKTHTQKPFSVSLALNPSDAAESSQPVSPNSPKPSPEATRAPVDPIKLAFEKAKEYKKSAQLKPNLQTEQNPVVDSDTVKFAMEKANKYKQNKGVDGGTNSGLKGENGSNLRNGTLEKRVGKEDKLTLSSIDFMGLNFADKKQGRGLPAGLVPLLDPFPDGDLLEVEMIVGDNSGFENATRMKPEPAQDENFDLYKPKVSTWGVFPRPSNISKTFGGGKTIRPGDVLETAEDRAAKDEHTRQLVAAYKKKAGLTIDAKLKSECEEALKEGDSLMDTGNLRDAMIWYKKVMDKLPFQSKLHGLAALHWSICQDSLNRSNEARIMYEKLRSHPNAEVSKKARQFMFSFQAMKMMKVRGSNLSLGNTGYQNYFEAFIEDKNNFPIGAADVEEGTLSQALLYISFLVSPILIVLFIVVNRVSMN